MKFEHGTQVRDYINWEYLIQNGKRISNYEFEYKLPRSEQERLLRTYIIGIEDYGRILILENK